MFAKCVLLAQLAIFSLLLIIPSHKLAPITANEGQIWFKQGKRALFDAVAKVGKDKRVAKNIILFIGDGMGMPTLTAARIYKGQKKGLQGEDESLVWENFNHLAAIKTYCADRQVPDSASTATALLAGVKTNYETIGLDSRAKFNVCDAENGGKLESIMTWGQAAGKSTGIVTTTRVTHATPSAAYAHTASRYWEADSEMQPEAQKCKDIARQLIEESPGNNFQVIFGGGAQYFVPHTELDFFNNTSKRKDNRDLIKIWKEDKYGKGKFQIVKNKDDLRKLDGSSVDYVLGLFNSSHMTYDLNRTNTNEPSLAEMTQKAIEVLSKNKNGYVLLVEGGKIDIAHHANYAHLALADTVALDVAVDAALKMVNLEETLVIVTADHGQAMGMSGYPLRGNPILGIGDVSDIDHMPFTTLLYHTGLGYNYTERGRANITGIDTADINYRQLAAISKTDSNHGGEDVLLYAEGPQSDLLFGTKEQNYVNHVMAYAAKLGSYQNGIL